MPLARCVMANSVPRTTATALAVLTWKREAGLKREATLEKVEPTAWPMPTVEAPPGFCSICWTVTSDSSAISTSEPWKKVMMARPPGPVMMRSPTLREVPEEAVSRGPEERWTSTGWLKTVSVACWVKVCASVGRGSARGAKMAPMRETKVRREMSGCQKRRLRHGT